MQMPKAETRYRIVIQCWAAELWVLQAVYVLFMLCVTDLPDLSNENVWQAGFVWDFCCFCTTAANWNIWPVASLKNEKLAKKYTCNSFRVELCAENKKRETLPSCPLVERSWIYVSRISIFSAIFVTMTKLLIYRKLVVSSFFLEFGWVTMLVCIGSRLVTVVCLLCLCKTEDDIRFRFSSANCSGEASKSTHITL